MLIILYDKNAHLKNKKYFRIVKKTFLLLADTIFQTTLRSYLRIVQRKNVSLVSNISLNFSLQIAGQLPFNVAGLFLRI